MPADNTPPPPPSDPPPASAGDALPLLERYGKPGGRWDALRGYWPWAFLAACLLAGAWFLVKPAPPATVVLAAGPKDGAYAWFAERYKETFAENGVTLDVRETLGSVDNYRQLDAAAKADNGPSLAVGDGVSVAIVQSGTCPTGITAEIQAVASLYLEPVWIFYRGDRGLQLEGLRGRRVAVGPDGSGTRSIAGRLLGTTGIEYTDQPGSAFGRLFRAAGTALGVPAVPSTRPATGPAPTTQPAPPPVVFDARGGRAAADALKAGQVDAAVFVFSPRHPLSAELLRAPGVQLMTFERHEAYARIFPFLSDVKLPRGTVDLSKDLPREDVYLLAPAANLVCRKGTHPAIVSLLIKAATRAHERGDLISPPNTLPSTKYIEFPLDPAADDHFRHGPPFLQRVIPSFWLAAFVDRMKILLVPLLTLLIPLARVLPPVYVWRIRSKIYRWYRVLREIDRTVRAAPAGGATKDPNALAGELAVLRQMDRELSDQKVPLSYMSEAYNLRMHTDYLRRRIEAVRGEANDEPRP